jgi:outer membrane protein TolC
MKTSLLIPVRLMAALFLLFPAARLSAQVDLTLSAAYAQMWCHNRSLQMAEQGVRTAQSARRQAEGTWWPQLQAEGAYVAMGNEVGVDFTLLQHSFSFPILKSPFADAGLSLTWPLFTGGQRLYGNRLARKGVEAARLQCDQTASTLQVGLITVYYALTLARQVEAVRHLAYQSLQRHAEQTLQLEAQGMMVPADVLYARLSSQEAEREWQSSRRQTELARQALCVWLGEKEQTELRPVTPFFLTDVPVTASEWLPWLENHNKELQMIDLQTAMARDRLRMAQARYLPAIALVGRQSAYAYHLPRNLLPRTMVGVGFTWTLFDGLRREEAVRQVRLAQHTLSLAREKATDELRLALDRQLHALQDARAQIRSLQTAVALNVELCRMRRHAFQEGMATSLEVTDAEVMQARTQVALHTAEYEYVVALARLCSLAGCPERFWQYAAGAPSLEPQSSLE